MIIMALFQGLNLQHRRHVFHNIGRRLHNIITLHLVYLDIYIYESLAGYNYTTFLFWLRFRARTPDTGTRNFTILVESIMDIIIMHVDFLKSICDNFFLKFNTFALSVQIGFVLGYESLSLGPCILIVGFMDIFIMHLSFFYSKIGRKREEHICECGLANEALGVLW